MKYLDTQRDLEIALNTTNFLIEKLEKFRHANCEFEISLNHAVLQTSSQFQETINNPDILAKHIFYVEDLFWAYSYIGPNTYKLLGEKLLNTLGSMLKESFSTTLPIIRIETNELVPERPILWQLFFVVKGEGLPDNVAITVVLIPKGKVYWLQEELNDYREMNEE